MIFGSPPPALMGLLLLIRCGAAPMEIYTAKALVVHMTEALLPEPREDTEAHAWMDAFDKVLDHPFVRCAAEALGYQLVIELGEACEEAGQLCLAAKRFGSAAVTGAMVGVDVFDQDAAALKGEISEASLLVRACELLVRADQTTETRLLEVEMRGRLMMRLHLEGLESLL